MLTFSKREFTERLNNATVKLLDLAIAAENKNEQVRLFEKRSGVEECLAWWFAATVDLDDEFAYERLKDLSEWIDAKQRVGSSAARGSGLALVQSYVIEYLP